MRAPRVPKLVGRQSVVGFLTSIMPLLKRIQIKQHLVDGEFVATMFDMETSMEQTRFSIGSMFPAAN